MYYHLFRITTYFETLKMTILLSQPIRFMYYQNETYICIKIFQYLIRFYEHRSHPYVFPLRIRKRSRGSKYRYILITNTFKLIVSLWDHSKRETWPLKLPSLPSQAPTIPRRTEFKSPTPKNLFSFTSILLRYVVLCITKKNTLKHK